MRPQVGSGGWACAVLLFVLTYRPISRHCHIATLLRRDLRPPALDPDGDIEVRTLKLLADANADHSQHLGSFVAACVKRQKLRGEVMVLRHTLARRRSSCCCWCLSPATAVLPSVGPRAGARSARRFGGGHHLHHGELGPTSSPPEAAARDHFEAVFTSYLRRHQATVALLDGPEPWADPEAAARMRLVVVEPSHEARCVLAVT